NQIKTRKRKTVRKQKSIIAVRPVRWGKNRRASASSCAARFLCCFMLLASAPFASRAQAAANDDGQWTMATKDYSNVRYSGLDQINTENAKNLKLAWTFSTGVFRGQEAAPLVIGDTMYVVAPFPNYLFALDL